MICDADVPPAFLQGLDANFKVQQLRLGAESQLAAAQQHQQCQYLRAYATSTMLRSATLTMYDLKVGPHTLLQKF